MSSVRTGRAARPVPDEVELEVPLARVYLSPIAPPVTLGLFGFFASTMIVSTWLLGWWGTTKGSPPTMFEIAAMFGGVAQFAAGLWSFRARDFIGSALLTMWGTYWMAWGFLQALAVAKVIAIPPLTTPQQGFAVWFIPLALFTSWGAVAAVRENVPLFVVLATVGSGSAFVCAGFWMGSTTWIDVGAWLFVFGACFAWYTGAMVLLEYAWGRVVLPFGVVPGLMKTPVAANVPGARISAPVEYALGHPGTRRTS
ncbi:MAG TPA: GPR1/FUN34/YaaH family transporter [Gaiellaceae bacterium]|nr:GPR1/FUN34/YaaH family transporter [Gaiellaceae bacterium]